jgi:outer membrane immunogenic protein
MLRKTNYAGVLSLLITAPSFAGFYVGASAGPEDAAFSQYSHTIGQNPQAAEGQFNVLATNHFSGKGAFGSIFGGYAWTWGKYYLAAEANGNLSSVKYELTNHEFLHTNFAATTFTIKSSEGVSLLPGLFLSDATLFYGRLGYSNGRIVLNEGADPSIMSLRENVDGFRYGVGVRHAITPQWSLMMDYSQVLYGQLKSYFNDPNVSVTKYTTFTPSTTQLALGIIYNFDKPQVFTK